MIEGVGEGTRESSSEVGTSDPFDEFSPKTDDGEASSTPSQYSSCGESEFERYCSANSAMGTPSLCSSLGTFHECLDSELGSMRSFGLGELSGLENFSLGGRFDRSHEDKKLSSSGVIDCLGDREIECCRGKIDLDQETSIEVRDELVRTRNRSNLYDTEESSLPATSGDVTLSKIRNGSKLTRVGSWGGHDLSRVHASPNVAENVSNTETTNGGIEAGALFDHGFANGSHIISMMGECSLDHTVAEQTASGSDGLNLRPDFLFDGSGTGRLSADDGTSSRYEHSEDDDSIYNYGTDDESKLDSYYKGSIQYCSNEKIESGNALVLNSSTAFGSEDWDDFVQETGENAQASVMLNNFEEQKEKKPEVGYSCQNSSTVALSGHFALNELKQRDDVSCVPVASYQTQGADVSDEIKKICSVKLNGFPDCSKVVQIEETNKLGGTDYSNEYLDSCSVSNIFETKKDLLTQEAPWEVSSNIADKQLQHMNPEEGIGIYDNEVLGSQILGKLKSDLNPLSSANVSQFVPISAEAPENNKAELIEAHKPDSLPPLFDNILEKTLKDSSTSIDLFEKPFYPIQTRTPEETEFYDELVHEMEEILLDSSASPRARFHQGNMMFQSQISMPSRDGGSTASTSGTEDAYILIQRSLRIDGVEVVGAKQKKGDVSLGERLVGVKEYTMYKLRVWSGKDQWEVERRYREFCTLYRRLKSFYAEQGLILPSPWSTVERESRKIFGNASPDVIVERSVLMQECLQSVLHCRFSSSLPGALIWFLSPQNDHSSLPASSNSSVPWSTLFGRGAEREAVTTFGKTVSLIVEMRPLKSMKQMLEAQHYTCAGCHKYFDDEKSRIREFVQTLGWGRPRLCEYTGQLFCSSCHANDAAVLPARVLHHWDFTLYPISQFVKSYLDSIHDQPMLCVSAVNPFLFSKVPTLLHVTSVRKKIGAMLPYVRCSFRQSIYKGVGSRRYLLESNDFFALRDLIDLSKGAFAALPVMVETVSRKILVHITEQCLVCCDVGVPCGAKLACDDPSSLIFPFQEGEVDRCQACDSVFHKHCFKRLTNCPCEAHLKQDGAVEPTNQLGEKFGGETDGTVGLSEKKLLTRSPVGFLSGLFSKSMQEKIWGPKDGDTVILMGSLPSTSLR